MMDDALALAETLAQRAPVAVGCELRAMAAGEYKGIDEGLRVEEQGGLRVRDTKDRVEGFTALLEKRKPVFRGE
jgi:enoyl-CoA hydratase/carnithine racemase